MSLSKNNRILLVDDNPDIHQDYTKILGENHASDGMEDVVAFLGVPESPSAESPTLELDSAFSGEEALQKVSDGCSEKRPFAMAFVDMRMPPGWDGLRTTEELWKIDPDLQIVICTAYSDNSWSDIIGRVGKTDKLLILKKPFDAIEVAQLATALTEKWELGRQARMKRDDLERLIQKRTKQLQHAALHDPLTDLPNRRLFQMRLAQAINDHDERNSPTAVLLLDLDRFKQVNDSWGHPIGDDLLKAVSARLSGFAGPKDTVARLGGDEFALIRSGSNCSADQERRQIADLAKRMSHTYALPCGEVSCPASIGVSFIPEDGEHPEELVRRADLALYRAKQDGRGTARIFESSIDAKITATRELEAELRRGINDRQYELHYQPIVSCDSGQVAKIEALVRWEHPSRGLLRPIDFIPTAEDTGLIVQLGDWILEEACMQAAQWPDQIQIAVNLSAVQFRNTDRLLESIVRSISRSGLRPERLELEITEGVVLQDCDEMAEVLTTLREMGISIVLDDFGIGYSNLNYLRRFPFNKLKLDRAFIAEVCDCPDARTIVRAVAELGRNLGLETTAEGVETNGQYEIVRQEGFDYLQGYLSGCPMPDADFEALIASKAPVEFAESPV